MSDNTLGDLTNTTEMHNQHTKKAQALGVKNDNAREALKIKQDFKSQPTGNNSKPAPTQDDFTEKENNQHAVEREKRSHKSDENMDPVADSIFKRGSDATADSASGVLTERRANSRYANEDDEESPEEQEEEEDEKENAMNRLKALLGSSKPKKKVQQPTPTQGPSLRKSMSTNEKESSNNDFLYTIERMRRELFYKLDIKVPNSDEEDDEISKIFYEGRDGQEYTVQVLQKFFESLRGKAKQFIQQYETSMEKSKSHPTTKQPEEEEKPTPSDDKESDKERIRRKLNEAKKQPQKQPSSSNKESLKSLLNATRSTKKAPVTDINEVIKVDSQVLNYGTVNPGKLLGSILVISNTSDEEQTIEINIDAATETYDRDEILKVKEFAYIEELTSEEVELNEKESKECLTDEMKTAALEKKRRFITNSENKHDCWFIENPKTKELTKKITLKLGAKCEQDFIIVLKTLQPKNKNITLSFLNLELPGNRDNQKYNEKRIQKSEGDDLTISEETKSKKLQVMLCGVIDPPQLICPKQVYDVATKQNKVPIALKPSSGTQKFRIPFKNNGSKDVEADFSFVKIGENKEGEFSMNEYLEFFCMPGTLKIAAKSTSILNVMVKVNMDKVMDAKRKGEKRISKNLFKLLIAKMTDSGILFSYFFDVTLAKE